MTRISYSMTIAVSIALVIAFIGFYIDRPVPEESSVEVDLEQPDQVTTDVSAPALAEQQEAATPGDQTDAMTDAERLATIYELFESNRGNQELWTDVPDLRYYLNPLVVESMRVLSEDELLRRINDEHSAEAAYWLATKYADDEESHVLLLLTAAGFSQKPGPLLNAINGCCSYTPGDEESARSASIKLEALTLIARELGLPGAADWPDIELDPDIADDVFTQRELYIEEINRSAMLASGQRWVP